jgi:hypothetical protein
MIVPLRQGIAHAVTSGMQLISVNDALVDIRMGLLQPRGQRRPQVVTDCLKVARLGIGTIALDSDLFVEVRVRGSARFDGENAGKGIFTRRLIKMPVQAHKRIASSWADRRIVSFHLFKHVTTFTGT